MGHFQEVPGLELREAVPNDLKVGLLETLAALSETGLTVEKGEVILLERQSQNIKTYVADYFGTVVGTASLLIETKLLHAGGRVAHVEDVAVNPTQQGQGIGQMLMRHLISEAKRLGCYKLILDCKPELINYYSNFGFRKWSEAMRMDLHV